ncbi:MAG: endolytic transglycosylase MltG [Oscillospiraceae bacterium]
MPQQDYTDPSHIPNSNMADNAPRRPQPPRPPQQGQVYSAPQQRGTYPAQNNAAPRRPAPPPASSGAAPQRRPAAPAGSQQAAPRQQYQGQGNAPSAQSYPQQAARRPAPPSGGASASSRYEQPRRMSTATPPPRQTPPARRMRDEYEDYEEDMPKRHKKERTPEQKAGRGCLFAFLIFIGLILVSLFIGYLVVNHDISGKGGTATEPVTITLPSGASSSTIGKLLEDNNLIGNGTFFRYYVRFNKISGFQAGDHEISPDMSYEEIIAVLTTAPPAREEVSVRIPEGVSIMKVASLFEEAGFGTAQEFLDTADNLDLFTDITIIQKMKEEFDAAPSIVVFHRSEGLIYPDTYNFFKDDTLENVIRKLYQQMDSKVTAEMYTQMEEKGITLRETLTLASLIQAEAGHADQQPKVSGVFWNRLGSTWQQQDGTMGSDVTIRYVRIWIQWNIPEYADKTYTEITYDQARAAVGDDLFYAYLTDSSYPGTRKGLPAAPICSVTETALSAALNPETSSYYYFLTDYYENYYYATTLSEHNKNVATMKEMNAKFQAEQASSEANTAT